MKNCKVFYVLAIMFLIATLGACVSMLYGDKGQKIYQDMPENLSDAEYCDYKVEKYKFPDGKVADVYVFEDIHDQALFLNLQKFALQEDGIASGRKYYKKEIAYAKEQIAYYSESEHYSAKMIAMYNDTIARNNWHLNVKGPMTPFYQQYTKLLEQYGGQKELLKLAENQSELFVVSYYKAEELGKLADCIVGRYASACYEDAKGVYWLRFSPPADLVALRGNKKEQARHSGEIGYEVVFIPRSMYPKIVAPKVKPAKVTPYTPNSIPDSDRNLTPTSAKGTSAYYYDENLAYQLQWLAVKIACKGMYDMAYTGDFRAKNPTDYYKTSFIKKYLATNDGKASKGTTLFEGICFDYADFAYQELSDNKKSYSSRIAKFYMVGTFKDANDIIAYRLAAKGESSDMTINRTPVVVFSHNNIRAHDAATNHAWFWVQATDGTMYWVDPTWTDNSGRPVYGIVRGGQEIQLPYDKSLCVN
ncbi:MAG: hypothetical protein IJJ71_05725 [Treponema sp.]|uniref:hypothetical protein n=1 Tax=Treponema sp. TaxID=166 RepID=UPI0025DE74B5|nr:hypothetical protein [Treponema sp.]MBR0495651.1 hypothetical protein [Treponema sp.]